MSNLTRSLIALALIFGLGCDPEQPLDGSEPAELAPFELEPSELEPSELIQPDEPELGEYGWIEVPVDDPNQTELLPPPSEGQCGGYWQLADNIDLQGCGTCTHTLPNPDRPGNLGYWWIRWCWTGPGCSYCEPWFVDGTECYDTCQ